MGNHGVTEPPSVLRALVICPSDRPAFACLTRQRPFVLVPILGRTLLDLWLADLAGRGVRHVLILAADRPETIRASVRKGEAWGLTLEVIPEAQESSVDSARARYRRAGEQWMDEPNDIRLADRLPGDGEDVWKSPADWLKAVQSRMSEAASQRLGMREHAPGVYVHLRARLSPDAHLEGPCWLGSNAWVGSQVKISAGSVVESAAYIDDGAEVAGSWIGPATMVGGMTEVRDSIAWGRGLYRWTTGSFTEIQDAFLLTDLSGRSLGEGGTPWWQKLLAGGVLLLLGPWVILVGWLKGSIRREGWIETWMALRTPSQDLATCGLVRLHRLTGLREPWCRMLELWAIVRGDLRWVGNRPLTPAQAEQLEGEFERLWVESPAGVFSLADSEGCEEAFGDEARAHASFYSVQRSHPNDLRILARSLWRGLTGSKGGRTQG
jgi:hypothetical protein